MAWNSMELTAGEDEVALVVVQGVEAKLHRLAHNRDVAPDFVVDPFVLEDLKCSNLIEDFRLVELDQVMDDHVRGPNMLYIIRADVDLALLPPVGAHVHLHPRLRPRQLVGQAQGHDRLVVIYLADL